MKQFTVKPAGNIGSESKMDDIVSFLNIQGRQDINELSWPQFPYRPLVKFAAAYSGNCIFLQYDVNEKSIRAVNTAINSAVWEDSCVEFFIAFDEKGYYNFEFNCIGTPLLGFGKSKAGRQLLSEDIIKRMRILSTVTEESNGSFSWKLTAVIPVEVFIHHHLLSIEKKECRANFYKCGDLLPEPHFLSWNKIQHPEPDFHLPEWFGSLNFQ